MEFESFGKIPRLNRDIIVTEKLDGTNAAVLITGPLVGEEEQNAVTDPYILRWVYLSDGAYCVQAQSRKRLIHPNDEDHKGTDNHGFASWVAANATELVHLLGPGRHFGEWWGQGIQGRYGTTPRHFSLFNVDRYRDAAYGHQLGDARVNVVPELYRGPFSQYEIDSEVEELRQNGSIAAPGYPAEGIIVFHTAAGHLYKVTCENDDRPKEVVAREQARVAAEGASIHWGGDGL